MRNKWLFVSFFALAVVVVLAIGLLSDTPQPAAQAAPLAQSTSCATYRSTAVLTIPDNDPVGITSTLNIPNYREVVSASVFMTVTHRYPSDLNGQFCDPWGTCTLFTESLPDPASTPVKFTFADAGGTGIMTPETPIAGAGQRASGAYYIKVWDSVSSDSGTVNGWGVTLCTQSHNVASPWATKPPTKTPIPTYTATPTLSPVECLTHLSMAYDHDDATRAWITPVVSAHQEAFIQCPTVDEVGDRYVVEANSCWDFSYTKEQTHWHYLEDAWQTWDGSAWGEPIYEGQAVEYGPDADNYHKMFGYGAKTPEPTVSPGSITWIDSALEEYVHSEWWNNHAAGSMSGVWEMGVGAGGFVSECQDPAGRNKAFVEHSIGFSITGCSYRSDRYGCELTPTPGVPPCPTPAPVNNPWWWIW